MIQKPIHSSINALLTAAWVLIGLFPATLFAQDSYQDLYNAKAIEKQNKAMSGAGGRTAVKLRIAEALAGKPILIVPAATGTNIQKLDVTRIVEAVIAKEATSSSSSHDSD